MATSSTAGACSTSDGPRTCLARVPWPCTAKLPPVGLLAAPHPGHPAGLAASTEGGCSRQCLTLIVRRIIRTVLVVEFTFGRARREVLCWPRRGHLPSPFTALRLRRATCPCPLPHGTLLATRRLPDRDPPACGLLASISCKTIRLTDRFEPILHHPRRSVTRWPAP